jgi:hypothetical protein
LPPKELEAIPRTENPWFSTSDGPRGPTSPLPSTPKPPTTPLRFRKGLGLLDFRSFEASEYQLGDAVAPPDGNGLGAGVLHEHLQFAPVVWIDGARAVGKGDPMTGRQAGSGPDLAFHSRGKFHDETGGHRPDLPDRQVEIWF